MILKQLLLKGFVLFLLAFMFSGLLGASPVSHSGEEGQEIGKKKFDPGRFILDHIADAYEWHIVTYEGRHISVPLPIILYSKQSGFHVFHSGKFNHGHDSYKGFTIETEGPYKGKITERLHPGTPEESVLVPVNLSITKNALALFFGAGLVVYLFLTMASHYRRNPNKAPGGIGAVLEPIILFVRDDIVKPAVGEKKYEEFLPYLLSLFFFIWINNMLGLIPIFPMGANVTGNITVAMGLALFTFVVVNINGNKHYWQDIFNTPGVPVFLKLPIPLLPIIEVVGMLTKPFVLMVRLFANITAGHIITLGFFSLIFVFGQLSPEFGYGISVLSVLFGIFMTMLELLVSLIQAYVFTLLTSLYIGAAVSGGH